jgi:hypothetical protein
VSTVQSTPLEKVYREVRAGQIEAARITGQRTWSIGDRHGAARLALEVARQEMELRQAEADDRIRFEVVPDHDYQPDGDYDVELERRKLEAGEWVALGVVAETPRACPHCGETIGDEWDTAASLWGIVVESETDPYVREVMRELASEALED